MIVVTWHRPGSLSDTVTLCVSCSDRKLHSTRDPFPLHCQVSHGAHDERPARCADCKRTR